MKIYTCCGVPMKVRPVEDEEGILFSYECDVCNDGFCRDPAEQEVDMIEVFANRSV